MIELKCPWCGKEVTLEEYSKHVEDEHMDLILKRKPVTKVFEIPEETMKRIAEALGMLPEEIEIPVKALPRVVADLYHLERFLSQQLQPPLTIDPHLLLDRMRKARDELREIMRKMGWKKPF